MSLPPAEVHIKRKRTDEPVDFLRVHEAHGKRRRRATDFIFTRQPTSTDDGSDPTAPQPLPERVRRIKPIHRGASSQSLGAQLNQSIPQSQNAQLSAGVEGSLQATVPAITVPPQQSTAIDHTSQITRHFHISRSSTPPNPLGPVSSSKVLKRKDKGQPTVFVERRVRHNTSGDTTPLSAYNGTSTPNTSEPDRPRKKPGLAARSPVPRSRDISPPKPSPLAASAASTRNVRLPSGLLMPWDVTSEQLAAEMQAYTLQEIGLNLAESEATKPGIKKPATTPRKPTKFKPKVPARRYAERHPDQVVDTAAEMDIDEVYTDDYMDEDGDYIIDTYIRIPAESLESLEAQKNVGLLILDSQPDIDEFYRDDDASDEEEDDEDEDENAENHYTADYPDEEVDSDDEYGRNAYNYRTHNASDLEEFDENDAVWSDDENEATKYPWMKRDVGRGVGIHDDDD